MMVTIQSYLHSVRRLLRRMRTDEQFRVWLRIAAYALSGFLLSAASLRNQPIPLSAALLCASAGWPSVCIALGGAIGYWQFWSAAGGQGVLWMVGGLLVVLVLGDRPFLKTAPLLRPACAALVIAAVGLALQVWAADQTSVLMYVLRILLAGAATGLFDLVAQRRDPIADWLACGLGVLALAQVVPVPYFGLGFLAAAALGTVGAFPAAAMAGLALDIAQVTTVPMTAVICLIYLVRLIPHVPKWTIHSAPVLVYTVVMALCGKWDMAPLPAMAVGGLLGMIMPGQTRVSHRRGETGVAQVRLEMVANAFSQAQQVLLEMPPVPVDEVALLLRTGERACGNCPCRKGCREREQIGKMDVQVLHQPLLDTHDVPVRCRKPGRILQELHRTQEQLRAIRADRQRQAEYRSAMVQQYRFLCDYLQELSDSLGRRLGKTAPRYRPEVAFSANRSAQENGDRCVCFAGVACRYYVILCDGMGTGLGAADEGTMAATMLKKLLSAGYPAEYALRSLNSLCALRGAAGAVTVDLCELQLDTGRVSLYKWGAAPSYLINRTGTEKIGTVTPPPGLSVTDARETVERLSLRRGETLVLLSDGVGGEGALCFASPDGSAEELAAGILEAGSKDGADDATVAVIRLIPGFLPES